MDTPTKNEIQARLRRIAGQVNGIQRMLDEERDCLDVVMQASAARAALAKVSRLIVQDLITSKAAVVAGGTPRERRGALLEILRILERCEV